MRIDTHLLKSTRQLSLTPLPHLIGRQQPPQSFNTPRYGVRALIWKRDTHSTSPKEARL
jgi:hypothetical protein